MKTVKRVISMLFVLAMAVLLIAPDAQEAVAAPKATGSLTVKVGKTKQINLTGDPVDSVTFSSTKPSVAKVDESGKVTGVKYGTAIVKAKVTYGSQSKTLKTVVTVVKKTGFTASKVYKKIIAMKKKYPEGKHWTNDNGYIWKAIPGVNFHMFGCAAFASRLSDAAFGKKTVARTIESPSASKVRVGDILRMGGDTHSVIVLKVETDGFIIAEGNYNSSVHWGRKIGKNEEIDYLYTRYD